MTNWLPIGVIIGGAVLYHLSQKGLKGEPSTWGVLTLAYLLAASLSFLLWAPWKNFDGFSNRTLGLIIVLGVACLSIEAGYLFAYKGGIAISRLFAVTSVGCTIAVTLAGILFVGEALTAKAVLGILLAVLGVVLIRG